VTRSLAFLLLLCALVVPRVAWSAHLAGHDELASVASVHTHHGDHVHDHGYEDAPVADHNSGDDASGEGLTHEHSPSLSVVAALLAPETASIGGQIAPTLVQTNWTNAPAADSRPDSILRPPRAA
jgi:hypothetical protein